MIIIIIIIIINPVLSCRYFFDVFSATKVFVNGYWLGVHSDPEELMLQLRKFRQKPQIPSEISLYRDIREREIYVFTDAGRVCRPLLVVEDNNLKLKRSHVQELQEASNETVLSVCFSSFLTFFLFLFTCPCFSWCHCLYCCISLISTFFSFLLLLFFFFWLHTFFVNWPCLVGWWIKSLEEAARRWNCWVHWLQRRGNYYGRHDSWETHNRVHQYLHTLWNSPCHDPWRLCIHYSLSRSQPSLSLQPYYLILFSWFSYISLPVTLTSPPWGSRPWVSTSLAI